MIKRKQLYKCEHCGHIGDVVKGGGPTVRCCGQAMRLLIENAEDGAQEQHVPVVEEVGGGILAKVGEVAHPMTKDHWIAWIEVIQSETTLRKHLSPGEKPEAFFAGVTGPVVARACCNLHGNWKRG